jgi:hypothetical protein
MVKCAHCERLVTPAAKVGKNMFLCPPCAVNILDDLLALQRGNPYDWPPKHKYQHQESCEGHKLEAGDGGVWLAAYGLIARNFFEQWKGGHRPLGFHHPTCVKRWER